MLNGVMFTSAVSELGVREISFAFCVAVKDHIANTKLEKRDHYNTSKHGTRIFFPLQSYYKKTLRKNVSKSARKYKRNVLMPTSYNTPEIKLIQYGRRMGKKVCCTYKMDLMAEATTVAKDKITFFLLL